MTNIYAVLSTSGLQNEELSRTENYVVAENEDAASSAVLERLERQHPNQTHQILRTRLIAYSNSQIYLVEE